MKALESFTQKYCFLDFEFNKVNNPMLNLVSSSYITTKVHKYKTYWLHKDPAKQGELKNEMLALKEQGFIFVSFSVEAEARSFMALGLDPTRFKWIDLWLEYRHLLNHNHKLSYGRQLTKEGKIIRTFPPAPKWERKAGQNSSKPHDSMASAVFKMLDGKGGVDTEVKRQVRDLIISAPSYFKKEEIAKILAYNESDIMYLPALLKAMAKEYANRWTKDERKDLLKEMLSRGEYAARTALMVAEGYPIDNKALKNFSDSVPKILRDIQEDINSQFDWNVFKYKKKDGKYSWNQVGTKAWIRQQDDYIKENWLRTPSNNLALSLEAFKRFYDFRHTYPRGNAGAQIVRYLHTKQNLNGFLPPKKGSKSFWDYVGEDGRVRPYFSIYGSQSARSQPSATGFLFLKSAWMRSLCSPKAGKAITGIDYKSEEFLLAALLSGDRAMLKAYQSGDVYLWFGKAAKRIPEAATKKSHALLRDKFKATTLAVQYKMGAKGLANKITNDTGEPCTEEEAQEYIDLFYEVFGDYETYGEEILDEYEEKGYLKLSDGWTMWGDNDNFRSVSNFPVQGAGSVVMRRAVGYAQRRGLKVIFTLHDALYIEHDVGDLDAIDRLAHSMDLGFRTSFPEEIRDIANVGLDANTWSPDYPDEDLEVTTPKGMKVKQQRKYVDERGIEEYEKFKKYFDDNGLEIL